MHTENTTIYHCTDCGSNATAYEKDGFFVICAGSRFGSIRNKHDHVMLGYRDFLSRNKAFEDDGLTLRADEKLLYADEAARVVTGCLVDESSWVAPDGSHPITHRYCNCARPRNGQESNE